MTIMVLRSTPNLAALYQSDETAWLDSMAELIRQGRFEDLDHIHLEEYLSDMARCDRREVRSRLAVLIAHLLKWRHQPNRRSGSWLETIILQRQKLSDLLESRTLRRHSQDVLAKAYADAVDLAAAESGLPESTFPEHSPFTLDDLLEGDVKSFEK